MTSSEEIVVSKETQSSGTQQIKQNIRCIVIKGRDGETREASQALLDPFENHYGDRIIKPPFHLLTLTTMPENCSELGPCIEAMMTNIDRLGYRVQARPGIHKLNEQVPGDVQSQIDEATNFFENCVLDQDVGTFLELKSRLRRDLETSGNSYIECIPTKLDRHHIAGLMHLPSWTMRLCRQDPEFTEYEVERAIRKGKGSWSTVKFTTSKRFRRFVQVQETWGRKTYFKEWGDPRSISAEDGTVLSKDGTDTEGREHRLAHEVIHVKLYCPRSPYGLPRWIGHLLAMYGNRGAEEINYMTLENNQVPAMVLLATNVAVTDGSIERMKEFIEERIQGNKNFATILMIEGEPVGEGMRDPGSMKLELRPMVDAQHTDFMFKEYMAYNDGKIRRSFRLPPLLIGDAAEYTRATAEASLRFGEEQIFSIERQNSDSMFNNTIMVRNGWVSTILRSNTPNVTDNYELTQLLATGERCGGLNPRIARMIVSDILSIDLPDPPDEINPDIPFSLTMALEIEKAKLQLPPDQRGSVEKTLGDASIDDVKSAISSILTKDSEGVPMLENQERVALLSFLQTL